MIELVALAISGLCFGSGMGASRHRAPRPVIFLCYASSVVALAVGVAALMFGENA